MNSFCFLAIQYKKYEHMIGLNPLTLDFMQTLVNILKLVNNNNFSDHP